MRFRYLIAPLSHVLMFLIWICTCHLFSFALSECLPVEHVGLSIRSVFASPSIFVQLQSEVLQFTIQSMQKKSIQHVMHFNMGRKPSFSCPLQEENKLLKICNWWSFNFVKMHRRNSCRYINARIMVILSKACEPWKSKSPPNFLLFLYSTAAATAKRAYFGYILAPLISYEKKNQIDAG